MWLEIPRMTDHRQSTMSTSKECGLCFPRHIVFSTPWCVYEPLSVVLGTSVARILNSLTRKVLFRGHFQVQHRNLNKIAFLSCRIHSYFAKVERSWYLWLLFIQAIKEQWWGVLLISPLTHTSISLLSHQPLPDKPRPLCSYLILPGKFITICLFPVGHYSVIWELFFSTRQSCSIDVAEGPSTKAIKLIPTPCCQIRQREQGDRPAFFCSEWSPEFCVKKCPLPATAQLPSECLKLAFLLNWPSENRNIPLEEVKGKKLVRWSQYEMTGVYSPRLGFVQKREKKNIFFPEKVLNSEALFDVEDILAALLCCCLFPGTIGGRNQFPTSGNDGDLSRCVNC